LRQEGAFQGKPDNEIKEDARLGMTWRQNQKLSTKELRQRHKQAPSLFDECGMPLELA
jgi:hypothetical protein